MTQSSSLLLSILLCSATTVDQALASTFRFSGSGNHHAHGFTPEQAMSHARLRAGIKVSAGNVDKRQLHGGPLETKLSPSIASAVVGSPAAPQVPRFLQPTTLATAARPETTRLASAISAAEKNVADTSATTSTATDDLVEEAVATKAASGSQWLGAIKVGSQGIEVPVSFDTGSSDTWFIADEVNYDTSEDTFWSVIPDGHLDIQYSDDTWAYGHSGTTQVALGDIVAKKQTISIPTSSPVNVSDSMLDSMAVDSQWGIVGLGFTATSAFQPKPQKSLFESLQDSLDEPLFTVDIEDGAGGIYTFGEIDPKDHSGPLEWEPLNTSSWQIGSKVHGGEGRWAVSSSSIWFKLGDEVVEQSTYDEEVTLFDTGTTLNLLEKSVVDRYYSKYVNSSGHQIATVQSSSGMWVWPCQETIPALEIGFANTLVTMNNTFHVSSDGQTCTGALQAIDEGEHAKQIIGDMWFKSAFAVFHGGNMSIGIAPKNK